MTACVRFNGRLRTRQQHKPALITDEKKTATAPKLRSRKQRSRQQKTHAVATTTGSEAELIVTGETVNRLRASVETCDQQLSAEGKIAGRNWAARYATANELRRLETACDPIDDWGFGRGNSLDSDADVFVSIIDPDGGRAAASDFWEGILDDRAIPESAYVEGFAIGASEVWSEAQSRM